MKRRVLAMLLLLAMVLSLIPAVGAENAAESTAEHHLLLADDFTTLGSWTVENQQTAYNQKNLKGRTTYDPTVPGTDAEAKFTVTRAGTYQIWVHAKHGNTSPYGENPWEFKVGVDSDNLNTVFGGAANHANFAWTKGNSMKLTTGEHSLRLIDFSANYARCDAVLVTSDANLTPEEDYTKLQKQLTAQTVTEPKVDHILIRPDNFADSNLGSWTRDAANMAFEQACLKGRISTTAEDKGAAHVSFQAQKTATYQVWVYAKHGNTPPSGSNAWEFKAGIDDAGLTTVFGGKADHANFAWTKGDSVALTAGEHTMKLIDFSANYARCGAILITSDENLTPSDDLVTLLEQVAQTEPVTPVTPPQPVDDEIIVDNTDSGFSMTGNWGTSTYRKGCYGNNYYSFSNQNGDSATATWQTPIARAGWWDIYVWTPTVGDDNTIADNAIYAMTSALGTTTVRHSQRNSGGAWAYLCSVPYQHGDTASVTLEFEENKGAVMADAMRFVYGAPYETGMIIDNTDSGFTTTGTWNESTGRADYYGSNYLSKANGNGVEQATATWTANDLAAGSYEISVWHAQGKNDSSISKAAPYTITAGGVAQKVTLDQSAEGMGGQWRTIGTCSLFARGAISVTLGFEGVNKNTAVMADAIRIMPIGTTVTAERFTTSGYEAWTKETCTDAAGGSIWACETGDVGAMLNAAAYPETTGGYRILLRKPVSTNVSQMSQDFIMKINGTSYNIDLTKLKDGWNTVGFCKLNGRSRCDIQFLRSPSGSVFVDAVQLDYVGYDLHYTEFSDEMVKLWTLNGMIAEDTGLHGINGSAYLTGTGWNNILMDISFIASGSGKFGLIVGGTAEAWETLTYEDGVFVLRDKTGKEIARSAACEVLGGAEHQLRLNTDAPYLQLTLDGEELLKIDRPVRSGNVGVFTDGVKLNVSKVGISKAKEANAGSYEVKLDDPQQTIWGLGIEVQSDSIGSFNQGLPEETWSVPHDLTESERQRLYKDMLSGFRFLRLATGLYYRGTDAEGKHLRERWNTQNEELAEMIRVSGIEGADWEYWSPTPYFKGNGSYLGGTLKCWTKNWEFYGDEEKTHEFLVDFANTIKEDMAYLTENGIPITQFGLNNEPHVGYYSEVPGAGGYSTCIYTDEDYYNTAKVVLPILREAYPNLHIHASSHWGQHGRGGALIRQDQELLDCIDAWTYHMIGHNSNDQIISKEYLNSNKGARTDGKEIDVYNNEFEYLDNGTSDWKCINTAQSLMNWMTFENSPTWHWLHMLKPIGNGEGYGYGLGFWRKQGDTTVYDDKYNSLEEGTWDYNWQNWNAIRGFLKYMPWDSVRYTVDEDVTRYDQRIMAWKTPEGQLVIALTNRDESNAFQFNLNTGLDGKTFHGYRYTPWDHEEIDLGIKTGAQIDPTLPALSIEFWVQDADKTMKKAESVTLDKTALSLAVNGTKQLTATVAPDDAANKSVRWTSSDSTVVKVDENGNLTALKEGTAIITATAISGSGRIKASCEVTVTSETSEVNKTALKNVIDEAETKKQVDYTEDSWDAFEKALEAAKTVYNDSTATQDAVNAATDALNAAIAKLEKKPTIDSDDVIGALLPLLPALDSDTQVTFPFNDFSKADWYYNSVRSAWYNGLIDGVTANEFRPDSTLTVAQAIKLAAALCQMEHEGKVRLTNGETKWYDTYVSYAIANGIIEQSYASYTDAQMNAPVTRDEFVHIFHGAKNGYTAISTVADGAIPDVKTTDKYAAEIYELYRAGILTGSDAKGTFHAESTIKRSEAATILLRMYDSSVRIPITLG